MRAVRHSGASRNDLLLLPVAVAALLFTLPITSSERVRWKPAGLAALVLDGRTVEDWQVYQAEERNQFLVRIGRRYLLLDTAKRQAWELDPTQFRSEDDLLVSAAVEQLTAESQPEDNKVQEPATAATAPGHEARRDRSGLGYPVVRHRWPRRLPTDHWVDRHAGRARLIQVRLTEEGRLLELQVALNLYEQIRR